ncbi:MAG TPA: glycosyltransferase family 2 protein [Thermoanaerobaculia bacterium]|nr:glycosyltransferase family 2 protein [Thermoanaerobaculia bacterium]
MKVTLLVPTLNEIDGMRVIMPLIQPGWVDQILILDGGSTDGTIEYAREQGYEVVIQEKRGLINAYRQVRPHIRGDVLITFSPDGNSVAERIPELVAKMREGYDMVIVSRYLGGAKSDDDTFMTRAGNWVFTKLINVLFSGHYTDAMVIFRAYRTSLIDELGLMEDEPLSVERNFNHMISWEPLLSMRAAKRRLRIGEIPGDEPARIGGQGKCMHYSWGAVYLMEMGQEFVRRLFGR